MHKFTILTEKEFETFAETHPYGSFHQTVNWGKLKKNNGWDCYLLGIKDNQKVIAASLILRKKLFLDLSIMYAPRGFLIDYENDELLNLFVKEIKNFANQHHAIIVKIDPCLLYVERDIDGKELENTKNNKHIVDKLKKLNFKHNGLTLRMEGLQPRWFFYINLDGKTEEEVLGNMEHETRRLLLRNIRNGVYTREIKEDELNLFKEVMDHTSKRRGFIDRPYSYYKNIMNIFEDDAKFMLIEINCKNYINSIEKEINDNREFINRKTREIEDNKPGINIEKTKILIEEKQQHNNRLNTKKQRADELFHENGEIIVLGGMLFLKHNNELLALFGGSYDKFMDFYPQYTIHWEMIKYTIKSVIKRYNFYGITGDFENKKTETYGLYSFKKTFGGQVGEYIGEFDLIVNPIMNTVYNLGFKIYKTAKRVKK
jgi:peptidoglycan pentaglycine glycine transferase (the second and third glycine)